MSLSIGLIAVVALVYMAILFAIAFYGDRRRTPLSPRLRAWVYSLSLAVYCTSWTFFGAVGQATDQLWSFLPIYVGPVLLMLFAPWVLQKMIMISKQENITSIADFIAARYGKSQALAVVVALICMVGVLPYIALQLKGIVLGVNLLIGSGADSTGTRAQDTALIVSLVLALFTIVFGTRSLDVTEHHRGMVLAIAFESLVKLTAFLAVGIFGVTTIAFGLSTSFWFSLGVLVVLGAADMISMVIRGAFVQLETPDEMRGRVSAVNGLFIGASNQLGEFESGLTAHWFGTVPAVVLGGIGTLVVTGAWMKLFPSLAQRDRLH